MPGRGRPRTCGGPTEFSPNFTVDRDLDLADPTEPRKPAVNRASCTFEVLVVCFGVACSPDEGIGARRAPVLLAAAGHKKKERKAAIQVAGIPRESRVASTRVERTPREARVRVDRAEVAHPWKTTHTTDCQQITKLHY